MTNRWIIPLLSVFSALASYGCEKTSVVSTSPAHAPLDILNKSAVKRDVSFTTKVETVDFEYNWILEDGSRVSSGEVIREINQYLNYDKKYLNPRLHPAHEASWYWSPLEAESNSEDQGQLYVRDETVIIIGVNPTVCLVVQRPTEYRTSLGGSPRFDTTEWWGFARVMLSYGVADGNVLPLDECGRDWPYYTEIVIPAKDLALPIDLSQPGERILNGMQISWDYVCGEKRQFIEFKQ